MRARVLAAQGNVDAALSWVRERGLSVDDDPVYLREFEHLTLARVLLIQARQAGDVAGLSKVDALLDRLLVAANAGGRAGSAIEILVLLALSRQAAGKASAAVALLERALSRAEAQGYVGVFAVEGLPMASLLAALDRLRGGSPYVQLLLAASASNGGALPSAGSAAVAGSALVVQLSGREQDVLALLATDLSGPDIARQLFVSLNTLRTHSKSIYAKLGVNSRREAVRRAGELKLLAAPR